MTASFFDDPRVAFPVTAEIRKQKICQDGQGPGAGEEWIETTPKRRGFGKKITYVIKRWGEEGLIQA